jgi:hypothetical protein
MEPCLLPGRRGGGRGGGKEVRVPRKDQGMEGKVNWRLVKKVWRGATYSGALSVISCSLASALAAHDWALRHLAARLTASGLL